MSEPQSTYEEDPLVVGLSDRGFRIGLYLEHLEEASFLYEQRLDLLHDPEVTWLDIGDFEERFEAHIDALVLGEDLALAVCRQQVHAGDFGELHAAVRVFCRQDRQDLVLEVLEGLDGEDEDAIQAATDALKYEMPAHWEPFITALLRGDEKQVPIAAHVIGYRRVEAGEHVLNALERGTPSTLPAIIWALGRLQYEPARVLLFDHYVQHQDNEVQMAAVLALLRLGEPQTVLYTRSLVHVQSWTYLPLGLGGSRSELPELLSIASAENPHPQSLLALGLLGDSSVVTVLLDHLGNESLAAAAATALYLITGADLYEEAFIPEELDEDALFEDELEKLRRGEPLTPSGEAPPGTTIHRLSQNQEEWQQWWTQNQSQFRPGIRYRCGTLYSITRLLETLTKETTLHQVRRFAYEELVIRYGLTAPFEPDLLVSEQHRALAQCAAWAKRKGTTFQAGKWYYAGRRATL